MEHLLICHECDQVVVKSIDGITKVRAKILVFRDGNAYAVCKGCNRELQVPIKLDQSGLIVKSKSPKLIISR
jgi:hypothetical protein